VQNCGITLSAFPVAAVTFLRLAPRRVREREKATSVRKVSAHFPSFLLSFVFHTLSNLLAR
jgi:hypothetical protein